MVDTFSRNTSILDRVRAGDHLHEAASRYRKRSHEEVYNFQKGAYMLGKIL